MKRNNQFKEMESTNEVLICIPSSSLQVQNNAELGSTYLIACDSCTKDMNHVDIEIVDMILQ